MIVGTTTHSSKSAIGYAGPKSDLPILSSDSGVYEERSKPDPVKEMTGARKIAIAIMLIISNSILFVSFGAMMSAGFEVGKSFALTEPTTTVWIAAALPLTQGAFVLISGRVGAVYGHGRVLFIGGAWWILSTLINGFCNDIVSFSIIRALTGIGAAFVVPNAVAIIGITFPPGRMRNLTLGFFGTGAPVGSALGCMFAGLLMRWTPWKWFFFFVTILGTVIYATLWIVLPPQSPPDPDGRVDWSGGFLGITSLILFNFVWNQAPAVGWSEPYIVIVLLASIGTFISFIVWELKFAITPIIPMDIWTAPSFLPLVIVVLFSVMSYGIVFWYIVAWQQLVRHWSLLKFAAGLSPHGIFGGLAAPVAAWLVPRVAAQWVLAFGAMAVLIANILIVSMPAQQSYWVQVFPATISMALCPDFVFTAAQIIACNSVKRHEQGIAGSLVSLLQLYGASIGLGFGGTVELYTNKGGLDTLRGYRGALYLAIGLAVIALVIDLIFVRMPKDDREGWVDEKDTRLTQSTAQESPTPAGDVGDSSFTHLAFLMPVNEASVTG